MNTICSTVGLNMMANHHRNMAAEQLQNACDSSPSQCSLALLGGSNRQTAEGLQGLPAQFGATWGSESWRATE